MGLLLNQLPFAFFVLHAFRFDFSCQQIVCPFFDSLVGLLVLSYDDYQYSDVVMLLDYRQYVDYIFYNTPYQTLMLSYSYHQ